MTEKGMKAETYRMQMASLREVVHKMGDPESFQAILKHGISVKPKPPGGVEVVIPKSSLSDTAAAMPPHV